MLDDPISEVMLDDTSGILVEDITRDVDEDSLNNWLVPVVDGGKTTLTLLSIDLLSG